MNVSNLSINLKSKKVRKNVSSIKKISQLMLIEGILCTYSKCLPILTPSFTLTRSILTSSISPFMVSVSSFTTSISSWSVSMSLCRVWTFSNSANKKTNRNISFLAIVSQRNTHIQSSYGPNFYSRTSKLLEHVWTE